MLDLTTNAPLTVYMESEGYPYLIVPLDQLDAVTALLRANDISFWTDAHAIALSGKPYVIFINLTRGTDATHVQRLLDEAK